MAREAAVEPLSRMTITLREVIRAAAVRQAPVTGELAGYLVLGVADQLALAPARATAEAILLEQDGTLRIAAQGGGNERQAVVGLRRVLVELTEVARPSAPALEALAGQSMALAAFIRRVEAALIPVNRSAARRALARLYRETHRAKVGGYLKAQPVVVADVSPDPHEDGEKPLLPDVDVAVEEVDDRPVVAAPETECEPPSTPLPRLPEVVEITLRVPEVELAPVALAGQSARRAATATETDQSARRAATATETGQSARRAATATETGALRERPLATGEPPVAFQFDEPPIAFEFDEPEARNWSIVSAGPTILDCTPRFGSVLWPAQPSPVVDEATAAEQTPADPTLYVRASFDDIPRVLQPFALVVEEPFVMPLPVVTAVGQEPSEACDAIVPEACDEIVPETAQEPDEEIPLLLVSRKPRPSDALDEFDALWDTIDWDRVPEPTRCLVKTPMGPEPVLAVAERDETSPELPEPPDITEQSGTDELAGEDDLRAEVDALLDALTQFESHGAHATDVEDVESVDESSVAPSDPVGWCISVPIAEAACAPEAAADFSEPPPIAFFDGAMWADESDGEDARPQSTEAEAPVTAHLVSNDSSRADVDGLFEALTSDEDPRDEVSPDILAADEASVAPSDEGQVNVSDSEQPASALDSALFETRSETASPAQEAEVAGIAEVVSESVVPVADESPDARLGDEPPAAVCLREEPADPSPDPEPVGPLPVQAEVARFTPEPPAPISATPQPEARVGTSRPWYRPRRSDLSDLLQRFGARHTRSERRLSHDLQRMVGIDLTPASGSSGTPPPVMVDEDDAGAPPTARRSWGRRVALYSTVSAMMLLAVAGAHRSQWAEGAASASRAECHATVTIDALAPGSRVRVRKQRSTEPLADRTAQNGSLAVPGLPCREALEVIVTRPGGTRWLRVPVESQALTPQPGADLASATITAR